METLTKLTDQAIEQFWETRSEWSEAGGVIQRTFSFRDFLSSMKFVNQIAELAEARQHHPDILVRYNKVTLSLSTHDAGGITQKDFDFAAQADEV